MYYYLLNNLDVDKFFFVLIEKKLYGKCIKF